jgi:hypothetical protein
MTRFFSLGLLVGLSLGAGTPALAQSPAQAPMYAPSGPVCSCSQYLGPHIHLGQSPPPGARVRGFGACLSPGTGVSPNEQGLPRGRRYYGGRYFGSFNNRFYGPQYGYF